MVSIVTLTCASCGFVLDMVDTKANNKRALGATQMEAVSHALDCLAAFLSRVPDELELTHRFVSCSYLIFWN